MSNDRSSPMMRLLRGCSPAMLALALLLSPRSEAATTCSASMTNLQFGASDPFSGWSNVTATISYTCSSSGLLGLGLLGAKVRMCFAIDDGAQGGGTLDPRRMLNGATPLNFRLHKDAARTQVWGTRGDAYGAVGVDLEVPVTLGSGSANGTLTVYGSVPANQTSVVPGAYSNSFSGGETELRYRYNEGLLGLSSYPASCTSGGADGGSGTFAFTASATVNARCNPSFAVQNLDFGTRGLLTTTIDTGGSVSPQCTNTTPYRIGLDNGQNAVGNTRRMRSTANKYVTYELYRDNGRTQRWGNTEFVDTVSGTGNGSAQGTPIYGRVAPQATPSAGSYSDTVTVTVYY